MKNRNISDIVIVIAFSAAAACAEDWPEFRGPTGQGISAARHVPVEWSGTKHVAWKQPVPGQGWSSPVLRAGRLYLTTATDEEKAKLSLRALCLDAASGTILWNTEIFAVEAAKAPHIHNKNSQASSTPLVEGERLYAHFGHHGTACLDLNGKVLWRSTTLSYPPVHGNGGSPIVVDGALIFSCDGASDPFIAALDKATGKVLWKLNRHSEAKKKFSFSTPLLITVNGQPQVITAGSGVVYALEPKTGKEIWRVRYGEGYSVVPRPVFGHGLIYLSSGFDKPALLAIRPDGRGDVTDTHIAWKATRGAPNTPSPLLVGDELYMVADSGIVSCLDARTGREHWQERIGGGCSASPVFADGKVYVQTEDGTSVVLKAGKEFHKLATNPLGERSLASYAVGDGALFIRTEQHLFRIE